MTTKDLKDKTKKFSLRIIKLADNLPQTRTGTVIAKQIVRSATSIGANYRAACRARSKADFISKITIVEEEADETMYWLEIINEASLISSNRLKDLIKEPDELVAIFTSSGKTAKLNINPKSTTRNPKSK
jgi:four helix bundle protein